MTCSSNGISNRSAALYCIFESDESSHLAGRTILIPLTNYLQCTFCWILNNCAVDALLYKYVTECEARASMNQINRAIRFNSYIFTK